MLETRRSILGHIVDQNPQENNKLIQKVPNENDVHAHESMTCVISKLLNLLAICAQSFEEKYDEMGDCGFACLAICSRLSEAINGAIFSNFEWLQN